MKAPIVRILIDTDEKKDCFRDFRLHPDHTLEQLHHSIQRSFGFSGMEMASFYAADDEWERGEEIPQLDMMGTGATMANTPVKTFLKDQGDRMLYVYDFLRMWCFMIEVINLEDKPAGEEPELLLKVGTPPAEDSKDPEDAQFEVDGDTDLNELYNEEEEGNYDDIDPESLSDYY